MIVDGYIGKKKRTVGERERILGKRKDFIKERDFSKTWKSIAMTCTYFLSILYWSKNLPSASLLLSLSLSLVKLSECGPR